MAETVSAMWWGRKHKIERLHALGLKAPGGRPPRIPDWLRRAAVTEAEKELAGIDIEAILEHGSMPKKETDAEALADLDQWGVAILLEFLRPPVGFKNRNSELDPENETVG
jgi:hypothetical protein